VEIYVDAAGVGAGSGSRICALERAGFRRTDVVGEAERVLVLFIFCVETGYAVSF
jgi:hypothetical protein